MIRTGLHPLATSDINLPYPAVFVHRERVTDGVSMNDLLLDLFILYYVHNAETLHTYTYGCSREASLFLQYL